MKNVFDVIVVGGGTSGVCATIAAARGKAKVLLIEKNGYLGGVMTNAGVGPMMGFHAGKTQVVQGIMDELINKLMKKGMSTGHIEDTTGFTDSVTPFDVEQLKREEEKMILQAGGEILYHTMLADVTVNDDKIESITVCNKKGLTKLYAKQFIDATGDGDLSVWSGVEYTYGRKKDQKAQPMTMNIKMGNVYIAKLKQYIINHPDEFPKLKGDTSKILNAKRLSIGGFLTIFNEAKYQGELSTQREDLLLFETNTKNEVILNVTRILDLDGTDPYDLTKAEIEGRKQAEEIREFLVKKVPGFNNANVLYTGPSIGVRSTRQIVGKYTLRLEDLVEGKTFEDTIAYGGYPVDIHSPDGEGTDYVHMPYGHIYEIPLRSLLNDKIKNLITVGRCISATFEAQSAIRLSPIVGAMGHAAGVIVSMTINEKKDNLEDVDYLRLKEEMIKQNAYFPS